MDTRRLIALVKMYPQLYDPKNIQYNENKTKSYIWQIIGAHFQEDVSVCKTRWRALRSGYVRTLQRPKDNNSNYKWRYESDLSFLKHHLREKGSSSATGNKQTTVKQNKPTDSSSNPTKSNDVTINGKINVLQNHVLDKGSSSEILKKQPKSSKSDNNHIVVGNGNNRDLISNGSPTSNSDSVIEITDNKSSIILDICSDLLDNDSCAPTTSKEDNVTVKIEKIEEESDKKTNDWGAPDNFATFFRAMTETLAHLPLLIQAEVKWQIYQAVHEAEIKYLQEQNHS